MKKLLALLVLVGCATQPKVVEKKGLVDELKKFSAVISAEGLKKPEMRAQALGAKTMAAVVMPVDPKVPAPKLFGTSAVSTDPFLGWYKTSIGFAKGEITESELQGLGLDLPYSWRVLTKWDDGSVRVGQLKTVGYFNGMGVIGVPLSPGKTPKPWFGWHPAVWSAISAGTFVDDLKVNFTATQGVTGAQAQPITCVPASGAYKFMVADTTEFMIRFRNNCFNRTTLAAVPIYLTTYFTFMSDDPVVRMQFVLGNDQLEAPVMGGWNVVGVSLQSVNLPTLRWVNENSYGNKSFSLADGQQMAWKAVTALDPAFQTTAIALSKGSPFGFQLSSDMKTSGAFGMATLPDSRVTLATVNQAHSEVNAQARFPDAQSSDWLGMIDVNPGATGAQSDFASTMPLEVQKAAYAYSSKQMSAVLLATSRESFRPSHYFQGAEWVSNVNHPNLFWWSGRVHYDWSWNNDQNPVWRTRTSSMGFVEGNRSGWNSDDNQHISHNTARYSWLLTGDAYLEDVLRSYVSVVHWNYFTDWINNVEAERAMGRSMKHAIELTEMFREMPEAALLKSRFNQKLDAYRNAVSFSMSRFNGTAVSVPFDGCDGRVNSGVWCGAQQAYGQGGFVAVGWMQGFINELMTMVENPDLRVLAQAESHYYLQDGTLKTYFPAPTPGQFVTGGIGYEWTAGWVQLAQKFPNAPGSQFVISTVKPMLEARIQNGCGFPSVFFCLNDSWKSY